MRLFIWGEFGERLVTREYKVWMRETVCVRERERERLCVSACLGTYPCVRACLCVSGSRAQSSARDCDVCAEV